MSSGGIQLAASQGFQTSQKDSSLYTRFFGLPECFVVPLPRELETNKPVETAFQPWLIYLSTYPPTCLLTYLFAAFRIALRWWMRKWPCGAILALRVSSLAPSGSVRAHLTRARALSLALSVIARHLQYERLENN